MSISTSPRAAPIQTMVRNCVVPDCPNTDTNTVSHRFPRKRDVAEKWQRSLHLCHIDLDMLLHKFVVCSKHFERTDYRNALSKHLNSTAVPRADPSSPQIYSLSGDAEPGSDVDNDVLEVDMDEIAVHHNQPEQHVLGLCIADSEATEDQMLYEMSTIFETSNATAPSTLPEEMNFEEYITANTDIETYALANTSATATANDTSIPYLTHTNDCTETSSNCLLNAEPPDDDYQPLDAEQSDDSMKNNSELQQRYVELIDLNNQLLVATDAAARQAAEDDDDEAIEAGSADHQSDINDSYVYVLEMNMPVSSSDTNGNQHHSVCSSDQLPAALLSDDDCSQRDATNNVQHQQQSVLIATPGADAIAGTGEKETAAISCLLSALTDTDLTPLGAATTDDNDEEPYALHDTVEVRLYNEMSKRSLIQLLVAANARISDLENRLGTIESAHTKVLNSLELFRSVLKR